MFQRNLILELIRVKSQNNPEAAAIIDNLIANKNFFVKNLENIQGDEKDIIIISTTFGKSRDGCFIQNFGPLTQEKGYKLLNVIITRAKHQLYVCTSIPTESYLRYSEEITNRGNKGKGIFYAYLAYAKAVAEGNTEQIDSILELLLKNCSDTSGHLFDVIESPFEQEVFDYLVEYLGHKRIKTQYHCGGFRIDIVIEPVIPDYPKIAIECDGAAYHCSPEAFAWDTFRQKQLEANGFIFYRIWSANWWENTEVEVQSLINFIEKCDRGEYDRAMLHN
jgi:very-short-patch-repair endonuclease